MLRRWERRRRVLGPAAQRVSIGSHRDQHAASLAERALRADAGRQRAGADRHEALAVERLGDLEAHPLPPAVDHQRRAFANQRAPRPGAMLGEVQGGAGVEADADQQDPGIAPMQLGQRGAGTEGVLQPVLAHDGGGERAERDEGVGRMRAADRSRPAAEGLGHAAHAAGGRAARIVGRHGGADRVPPGFGHRRRAPVGGIAQVRRLAGHDQGALRAERVEQGLDDGHGAAVDPAQRAERAVRDDQLAGAQPERAQVGGKARRRDGVPGPADLSGFRHAAAPGFGCVELTPPCRQRLRRRHPIAWARARGRKKTGPKAGFSHQAGRVDQTCAPAFGSFGSCAPFFSRIRSSRLMPSHIASEPATNTDE